MAARDPARRAAGASAAPAIELRHLRYFLAVIEELHFGRAAERLHIAQPPLSQAIRKLEDELGLQLLHRTSRVVQPTEAGQAFAEEASNVLAALDVAVAEARRAAGETAALRIGCVPNLPLARLRRFLDALQEREPGLCTRVTHLISIEQIKRLRRGELDLGIFHAAGPMAGLELQPLFPGEPLAAHLPRLHRLSERTVLTPADLRDEVLVIYPRAGNPQLADRLLASIEDAGYRFGSVRAASSLNGRDLMLAVAAGEGVALAPRSVVEVAGAHGLVSSRALDPPVSMPDTVVAWSAQRPRWLSAVLGLVSEVARAVREA